MFTKLLPQLYFSHLLVYLHPDEQEHETSQDGNEAEGCSQEPWRTKAIPLRIMRIAVRRWNNQEAFVSSDTENDHDACEEAKKCDHKNNDKHSKRIVEVCED